MDDLEGFIAQQKKMGVMGNDLVQAVNRYKARTGYHEGPSGAAKGAAKQAADFVANLRKSGSYSESALKEMEKRYAARILGNAGKTLLKVGGVIGGGALAAAAEAAGPQGSYDKMAAEPYIDTGETKEQYKARKEKAAMAASRKANPGRTQMFNAPASFGKQAYPGQGKLSKYMGVGKK